MHSVFYVSLSSVFHYGMQVTVENYFLVPDTGKHCRRNNTFLRDSAHYAEISTCKQKLCTIHDLLSPHLTYATYVGIHRCTLQYSIL